MCPSVTVRRYVAARARASSGEVGEVFVPLVRCPGVEAEVDWGEAQVVIAWCVRSKVHLFLMRACSRARRSRWRSRVETQQAFLEGHVAGVRVVRRRVRRVRYDNLKAAVKKVLKGRRRVETDRFVALRSHYLFESSVHDPGLEGAHEKGGVEGEVGRFRRRHLVPVPERRATSPSSTRCCSPAARPTSSRADRRARQHRRGGARRWSARCCARCRREAFCTRSEADVRASTRRRWSRSARTATRSRSRWPGCKVSAQDRRAGDRDLPRRSRGRAATSGCRASYGTSAQLDHYLELLRAQARCAGALPRAAPGARPWRLAGVLR